MDDVKARIEAYTETVSGYRAKLHRHPELGHREKETARFLAETLRGMGLSPREGVGGYGVTAVIEGSAPGRCIGLRADMDALPGDECTGLPYASENEGVVHACGHDMHMAMLLGAAHVLSDLRGTFPGSVKLIFQPAEEDVLDSGARKMIADGCLENPHVDALIGQHVWPLYETGTAAIRNGAMMASSDRFFITVRGKSCHGSAPDEGVDAIVIAAQIVTALQSVVSRSVSPLDAAVVTVGMIHGGERYNIVAGEVRLEGTCRTLTPALWETMPERIGRVARGVSEAMGGTCEYRYCRGYSPTVNAPEMFELVHGVMREQLGSGACIPERSGMGGEDFSFFGNERPSAFYWLGCRPGTLPFSESMPLHNPGFSPDPAAMPVGMRIMTESALRYLRA